MGTKNAQGEWEPRGWILLALGARARGNPTDSGTAASLTVTRTALSSSVGATATTTCERCPAPFFRHQVVHVLKGLPACGSASASQHILGKGSGAQKSLNQTWSPVQMNIRCSCRKA